MFSKKIISVLIVLLFGLYFADYAACLEDIIQEVKCEYFAGDYGKYFENLDNVKNCECTLKKDENTKSITMRLCNQHSKYLDTWMEIFSKSDMAQEKNTSVEIVFDQSSELSEKSNCINEHFDNIFWGVLCKYFCVDCNNKLVDYDCKKDCECKLLKKKDSACAEICLCKMHRHVLKKWSRLELNSGEDANTGVCEEIKSDDCDCTIRIGHCGCQSIYICDKHALELMPNSIVGSDSDSI